MLREEPDLRSVLDLLVRFERVYNEALHLRVEEGSSRAYVWTWLEFGEPAPPDEGLDLVMGALVGIIRALLGPGWTPAHASFSRPPPRDPRPWQNLFGTAEFAQRSTGLVVRAVDLDAPLVASDASLRPYTRAFLQTVLDGRADGAATERDRVAEAMELLMPLGRHSVGQVSRYLGVHPRALQRSLAYDDETFSSLLNATRARLVEQYLPIERYSFTELSQILGFGAPSAFSRWFHQQFGTSPTEWRRLARDRPPR